MANQRKRLSRKQTTWIVIGSVLGGLVLLFLLLWPLINRFIPPDHYSGVELYESGEYLQYDDGELFRDHIAQLPFAVGAEILSFDYYDFWFRDSIFIYDPFPDVYVVQLEPTESFDSVKQYLEDGNYDDLISSEGEYSVYYLGDKEDADSFYVSINEQRHEVFCFMVTDMNHYRDWVDSFYHLNIGKIPGE